MKCISYCLLLGLLLSQACVDPYDPDVKLNARLVVVSALITDEATPQPIVLTESVSRADSANQTRPINRATVTVLVNGSTPVSLRESPTDPGTYVFPSGFRGQVGNTYQLRFQTEQGSMYESSVETMAAVPPIARAYDEFNPTGFRRTANAEPVPTNDVYIDFVDPANQRNFYLWRWRLYETQLWCATCNQGRYVVRDIGPVGAGPIEVLGCVTDRSLPVTFRLDYACRGLCWEIFYSQSVNTMSDIYTNGTRQVGRKIASIPIYQIEPALLAIEQVALSANAYRYYQRIVDQVQNTGTLADSPPAPLAGNIRNLANPNENVVGYFSAGAVATYPYKINRRNLPVGRVRGLFFTQFNREPNTDAGGPLFPGQGVASAICIDSRTRTPNVPPGWNQ